MAGSPPAIPSVIGIVDRLTPEQITTAIKNGKGRMPGFPNLSPGQLVALVDFLANGEPKELGSVGPELLGMKYRFTGYRRFLAPAAYPPAPPPCRTLNPPNPNTPEYLS